MKKRNVVWIAAAFLLAGMISACEELDGGLEEQLENFVQKKYTITFYGNGGTAEVTSISRTTGTSVAKPADPARAGYTFNGWFSAAEGGALYAWPYLVTGDVTMHAQWTAITYTVAYNANVTDNSVTGGTASSTHTYGVSQALTSNGFSRTGYTFGGWNTQANGGGESYTNGQSVTNLSSTQGATVNLYAKWTKANSYNVTIGPLSHGSVSAGLANAVEGATVTLTVTPDSGYFLTPGSLTVTGGASVSDSGNTYTFTMPAENVTVSAAFMQITYYVQAAGNDSNSGSQSNPFATIAHAIQQAALSDNTIGVIGVIGDISGNAAVATVNGTSGKQIILAGISAQTPNLLLDSVSGSILTISGGA